MTMRQTIRSSFGVAFGFGVVAAGVLACAESSPPAREPATDGQPVFVAPAPSGAGGGNGAVHPCAAMLCPAGTNCVVRPDGQGACENDPGATPPKPAAGSAGGAGAAGGAGGAGAAGKPCIKTGCSGTVWGDESMMSTCEHRPEYECYQAAVCERDASGRCGFRQTAELKACLAQKRK